LSSEEEEKWVEKREGLYLEIMYKKGKENVVVDAISRIATEDQEKWVEKKQEFYFEIIYKKGKENVVSNALSRIE